MNMTSFDPDIWLLHRKLYHRYVKYHECFDRHTADIPSYKTLLDSPPAAAAGVKKEKPKPVLKKVDIIDLLTSSSEDSGDDSGDD